MSEGDTPRDGVTPPDIRVRRGNPTDEELAALLAVVGGAYAQEPATSSPTAPPRSRWELSSRSLRQPLARERGWGGFEG